jgi:hypothetical protein
LATRFSRMSGVRPIASRMLLHFIDDNSPE